MRSVHDFGATGKGEVDDTAAIQHAVDQHAGQLYFPPGTYKISQSINMDTSATGRASITGSGCTAKVLMTGPGPAFRITGTHGGSAGPETVSAEVWDNERLPTIQDIEIVGAHDEADGVYLEGVMMCTFAGVLIRKVRHGIHIGNRARNILVSHCHIYDNLGIGIFLDHVNLHQVIVVGSHISYNRLSGIKILNGQVRNVQITGNDIEYNYDRTNTDAAPPAAEIWIETSGQDATIREGTIAGNTIQSRYSPGGANIMMIGSTEESHRTGMWTVSGNLIGSQETNVKLVGCRAVTVTGNVIYSGHVRNFLAEDSRNIVVSANTFDHNPDYLPKELATGVTFRRCTDSILSGSCIQDAYAGKHTVDTPAHIERQGLVEIIDCQRLTVNACQVLDSASSGIYVKDSRHVAVSACTVLDTREERLMNTPIQWIGACDGAMESGNVIDSIHGASQDAAEEATS